MNCDKARELILTDYIDGRVAGEEKKAVEKHLAECAGCGALYASVKKELSGTFASHKRETPPAEMWGRIREAIVAENEQKELAADRLRGFFKNLLCIPRPVLAVASLVLIFLVAGVVVGTRIAPGNGSLNDLAAVVEYSIGATAEMILDEETGFGTIIEENFL